MTAQGETWTAAYNAVELAMSLEADPMERAALDHALAIVRLHPELLDVVDRLGVYLPDTLQFEVNDLLARAHALGEGK